MLQTPIWLHGAQITLTHPEWCTHASVVAGKITSFVTCPSNDMLLTYENATSSPIGKLARQWTQDLLDRLSSDRTVSDKERRLTGHFSFDFIQSTKDGKLYPLECNARVHTAVIMLPVSEIASAYPASLTGPDVETILPHASALPRSWIYNDIVTLLLPLLLPSANVLGAIHPSLPACLPAAPRVDLEGGLRPKEDFWRIRFDPTLVADDWVPFLVLWHVYWPALLVGRWWQGKKWTRVSAVLGHLWVLMFV
jgi:hypothetical protein